MHSHDRFIQQGTEVLEASTTAEAECLAKDSGIKGVPLLSSLNMLNFPLSLSLDFMHLFFENLIPNLIKHYTGTFKDLDSSVKDYKLSKEAWSKICTAGSASGNTIPSSFGSRMPNLETECSSMTAKTWAFWCMYLAPILLQNHFTNWRYYNHFLKLMQLIHKCISFELKRSNVDEIRQGFQDWVLEYEEWAQARSSVHLPADLYQEYSINKIHCSYQPALLQCTVCCTLLMALRPQDQCGWPGRLWWNDTAATLNGLLYGVESMPWQVLTIRSLKQPSWKWWRWSTDSPKIFLLGQSMAALRKSNSLTVYPPSYNQFSSMLNCIPQILSMPWCIRNRLFLSTRASNNSLSIWLWWGAAQTQPIKKYLSQQPRTMFQTS